MSKKRYNIRLQDFTPFLGPLIFNRRNYEKVEAEGDMATLNSGKYYATFVGLTVIDYEMGFIGLWKAYQLLPKLSEHINKSTELMKYLDDAYKVLDSLKDLVG